MKNAISLIHAICSIFLKPNKAQGTVEKLGRPALIIGPSEAELEIANQKKLALAVIEIEKKRPTTGMTKVVRLGGFLLPSKEAANNTAGNRSRLSLRRLAYKIGFGTGAAAQNRAYAFLANSGLIKGRDSQNASLVLA